MSYRHVDNAQEGRRWAEWLHRALERYVVPPDLVGTPNLRGEPIPASLYPIFRDKDELPANADLATGIRAALEVSDHLIVLCSPRTALSPWVRKEVREFKGLGRSDRLLAGAARRRAERRRSGQKLARTQFAAQHSPYVYCGNPRNLRARTQPARH